MDSTAQALDGLRAFRGSLYRCFERRADALFELADAMLTAGAVPSPVYLSLAPAHRRGWGSLYAALSRGRIEEGPLRELLAQHASTGNASRAPVYAVDVSVWSRCEAEASPGRGYYYYHPSRHSAGQPIVAGWAYQLVAGLSFERDSWVVPTDARRIRPEEDANEVAVAQVKDLLRRPPGTRGAVPLFVFDAGYDPVKLQRGLEGHRAHVLVRLHSNRVFYADPEEVGPRPVGRPRRHGKKFALPDPETWPQPAHEHRCLTEDYGSVRVRAWSGLHPKTRRIGERYGCERAPVVRGTVVLVEVGKLPRETRKPKALWLWFSGGGEPDLDLLWRAYVRRFDLEHAVRFLKQTLGWTAPRVRHPEQADRWTWLVLAAYAQLGLARSCAADRRLPWERPQRHRRLTPCRTLRGFAALLAAVGTPARVPKPCGRSPGRPKGRLSGRAKRYPVLKKGA
ncbi:MAG: transposase [Actinomycetota bacterium]|nr:transposase [Actinomycetota bacterium]